MSTAIPKTNAARELDRMHIAYTLRSYEVDENDLSAVHTAKVLGIDVDTVFKTLTLRTEPNGIMMACIPGAAELDFKKFAAATGNKTAEMLPLKELQPVTGYVRGGCSPIGAKKNFPVVIDETAQLYDVISISAGKRGVQILLNPLDLQRMVNAKFADIVR